MTADVGLPPPARTLVLASASPARLALLTAAGFAPVARVSGVDEDAAAAALGPVGPASLALALAKAKAAAVAGTLTRPAGAVDLPPGAMDLPAGAVVLGCDSVLELDGAPYGKPRDLPEARARWRNLAGREGLLHTGHAVTDCRTGAGASAVATTVVRFAEPTHEELEAYLATEEPLAVAGAFTLDGLGAPLIEGVDGCPGNVIGVSPPLLRRLLSMIGVPLTDVWPRR